MIKYHKDTCLKEIKLRLQIFLTTLLSVLSTIGMTDVSSLIITKPTLPITTIKSKKV